MADTLAEIYRDTLTESDFDSNGEATIVTTDSSTSHVVKGVQVVEGNSKIPVAGNIDVNGFNVVALTGNSSGTEIVAPSSTVKVKTSNFPLVYEDVALTAQASTTDLDSFTTGKLNGVEVISFDETYSPTIPNTINEKNDSYREVAFGLGPNNYAYVYVTNHNNDTTAYLYNTSDGQVWEEISSYTPKWFDGERYVYWYKQGFPAGIHRLDTWTGTAAQFKSHSSTTPSTYAKMFGVPGKYLFFWPRYDLNKGYVYSFATDTISDLTGNDPQYAFSFFDRGYYAVETSTDVKIIAADNDIQYWSWEEGKNMTNEPYNTLSLSGGVQTFRTLACQKAALGSRLYYVNDNRNIVYAEFEGTPALGKQLGNINVDEPYGPDLTYRKLTPTASQIAARNYGTAPSLGLRITGVTST